MNQSFLQFQVFPVLKYNVSLYQFSTKILNFQIGIFLLGIFVRFLQRQGIGFVGFFLINGILTNSKKQDTLPQIWKRLQFACQIQKCLEYALSNQFHTSPSHVLMGAVVKSSTFICQSSQFSNIYISLSQELVHIFFYSFIGNIFGGSHKL